MTCSRSSRHCLRSTVRVANDTRPHQGAHTRHTVACKQYLSSGRLKSTTPRMRTASIVPCDSRLPVGARADVAPWRVPCPSPVADPLPRMGSPRHRGPRGDTTSAASPRLSALSRHAASCEGRGLACMGLRDLAASDRCPYEDALRHDDALRPCETTSGERVSGDVRPTDAVDGSDAPWPASPRIVGSPSTRRRAQGKPAS